MRSQNCEKRLLTSSYLFVRPSIRMEKLGSHWTDFDKIWYFFLSKICRHNSIFNKSDKNNGYFTWRSTYIYDNISPNYSANEECFRQNTHFSSITFSPKILRLWDNVEKYSTARYVTNDNIIRCMRFLRCITKATSTHTQICNTSYFSTSKVVTHTYLNITLYVHCLD
jgi:hypothetical protein